MFARRVALVASILRLCLCGGLLLSLALAPLSVRADANEEARVLFDAGVGASAAERWTEAREHLRRSAALVPKAATLLNLAVAEVKLGMRSASLTTLDAFDRIADPKVHADMIERAHLLRTVAEQLPSDASPADTGVPPLEDASERNASAVPPAPVPSAALPVANGIVIAAPIEEHDEPPAPAPPPGSLLGPRIMLGTGAVLFATSIVGAVVWLDRIDALESCAHGTPKCDNRDTIDRQRNAAAAVTIASGVISLGVLAVGTTWLVRRKRSSVTPLAEASARGFRLGMAASF